MDIFFVAIGSLAAILFLFAGAGANVGLGIICGLSFIAAALVKVAHAIELSARTKKLPDPKPRQAWSAPDKPVDESGTGAS